MNTQVKTTVERIGNVETTLTKVMQPVDEFEKDMRRPHKYGNNMPVENGLDEAERMQAWFEHHHELQLINDEKYFPHSYSQF